MGKLINRILGLCLLISSLPGTASRMLSSLPGSASRMHVESLGKPRDVNNRAFFKRGSVGPGQ